MKISEGVRPPAACADGTPTENRPGNPRTTATLSSFAPGRAPRAKGPENALTTVDGQLQGRGSARLITGPMRRRLDRETRPRGPVSWLARSRQPPPPDMTRRITGEGAGTTRPTGRWPKLPACPQAGAPACRRKTPRRPIPGQGQSATRC